MIRTESLSKIAIALVKAQAEMSNAVKDSKNPFFKSSYADLNSVREACTPALNKYGISVLQPTVVSEGKNYVQTVLLHESGEFISSLTEIKVKEQNNPQAEGSGISYARRYGLQAICSIGADDDDGERAVGRYENKSTKEILTQTEVQGDGGAYVCKLKKYKDIQLRKIPAHELAEYCTYLKSASETEGKALTGDAKELVDNARKYLISINYYAKKD